MDNSYSKAFVENVVPTLNEEQKLGFFEYTNAVAEAAKEQMKQVSPIVGAHRKQQLVSTIYNNGQPSMKQQGVEQNG